MSITNKFLYFITRTIFPTYITSNYFLWKCIVSQERVYNAANTHLERKLRYLNYFYIIKRGLLSFYAYPYSDMCSLILSADKL